MLLAQVDSKFLKNFVLYDVIDVESPFASIQEVVQSVSNRETKLAPGNSEVIVPLAQLLHQLHLSVNQVCIYSKL